LLISGFGEDWALMPNQWVRARSIRREVLHEGGTGEELSGG
jgi:hypothetical protein